MTMLQRNIIELPSTQQIDRPALPTEDIRNIYDETAQDYARWSFVNEYIFGVRWMRRKLLSQATGYVLDVAAGTGANFPFLPQDCKLTAIDLSYGMLKMARERADKLGRIDAKMRIMNAEVLDFPDNHFDTVISALSTCTFPDPIAVLHEMQRVVKPEGKILLLEHGRSSLGWFARFQDYTARDHFEVAGCRWNQQPEDIVAEAGLTVLNTEKRCFGVFTALEISPR